MTGVSLSLNGETSIDTSGGFNLGTQTLINS